MSIEKTYHKRETGVNMIYCADEGTFTAPLTDLVLKSGEETPLESTEIWEGEPNPKVGYVGPLEIQQAGIFQPARFNEQNNAFHETTRSCPAPSRGYCAKDEIQKTNSGESGEHARHGSNH